MVSILNLKALALEIPGFKNQFGTKFKFYFLLSIFLNLNVPMFEISGSNSIRYMIRIILFLLLIL